MARRTSLLSWEVPADQEEPWRRFLQELSGPRREEYAESRRRLGVSAERVWLAPKRFGGGVAVVRIESEDPGWALGWALRELAASDDPFDSWYRTQIRKLFGCDISLLPRVSEAEILFAWPEDSGEGEPRPPEGS
jgi:hypothetical protein